MRKKLNLITTLLFIMVLFIPTIISAKIENDEFQTADSSSYTVEFTYNSKEYVMKGDTRVLLEDILEFVGLSGEISSYEISNKNLFDVIKINNRLYVEAKKAFTTNEWLDVVVNEKKHHIIVTDAIIANRTMDNTWVFMFDDSTNTLTIRLRDNFTEGGLGASRKTETDWKKVWQKSGSDTTDIRPLVQHIKFVDNNVGTKFDFNEKPTAYMFYGFTNLEDIDFSGVKQDSKVAETIRFMFGNCSKLKEVDLSWMATKDNSLQVMQDLFNGCSSLEKVTLNNPKFITRKSTMDANGNVGDGAAQMARMFQGCSKLKEIDMSNITLYGRDNNWTQINNVFVGNQLISIETIKMDNIKLPNYKNLDSVFADLKTLTNFSMKSTNPGDVAPDVQTMTNMFQNSFSNPAGSGTVTLDISGLGKLGNIINMNNLIAGCSKLEVLNIDNLDNSNIGPTNNRHTLVGTNKITQEEARKIGAKEYGKEIFGVQATNGDVALTDYKFPKLKQISARNANVWMAKNGRGLPGSEYWLAANNNDVLYFTNKNTLFKPDGKQEVQIDSKRDYVDLIVDRDGNNNHTLNPSGSLPDQSTNINILGGDLNKLGDETFRPGKLAPGVYTIGDTKWDENKIKPAGSYYRISYIGEVDYIVYVTENDKITIADVNGVHYINTKSYTKEQWDNGVDENGNYVIDCSGNNAIKITYLKAGQDVEGRLYDIEFIINKITFKDLDKIPLNPERGSHDGNKYINYNPTATTDGIGAPVNGGEYFRTILKASKVDGVIFRNYVRVGNPTGYRSDSSTENDGEKYYSYRAISGGSGTDIDFTVKFVPADGNTEEVKEDKTFVFFVDDLDVPATQEWAYPVENDPCYDTLTVDKATYGLGGEAFVLGSGNKLDSITFAEQTGLKVVNNNTVITTGSDPSTSWSEFSVKADPKGSNYTWTSGIAADTYALRNTLPPGNEIKVIKKWEDRGADNSPRPENLDFEIKYTKDGNQKTVIVPDTAKWDKTSKANEWSIIFTDEDNTFMPSGGYLATESSIDKYDTVQGANPLQLKYNEDTGYFEVTFINKEQTKDVTVTKKWIDTDEQKHRRPEKIEIELKDDKGNIVDTYKLSKNESSHTFTVPKYDKDGNEIDYSVDEKEINAGDLKFYEKSILGTEITNKFKVPDEKIDLKVEKKWADSEAPKNRRPQKINIQVLNGDKIVQEYELDTETETTHIFSGLKKYDDNGNEINYSVDEKEINAGDLRFYTKSIGEVTNSVDVENKKEVKITNTYKKIASKVIVKYIDKNTNEEIIESITIDGSVDYEYTTELKDIANYKFLESTDNTSGIMTEDTITVEYYYEKVEIPKEDEPVIPDDPDVPETGDNIITYVLILLISLCGLVLSIYVIKNKKQTH